jgi:hypothetical protein
LVLAHYGIFRENLYNQYRDEKMEFVLTQGLEVHLGLEGDHASSFPGTKRFCLLVLKYYKLDLA